MFIKICKVNKLLWPEGKRGSSSNVSSCPDLLLNSWRVLVLVIMSVVVLQWSLHALYLCLSLKRLPYPAGVNLLKVVAVGPWSKAETATGQHIVD